MPRALPDGPALFAADLIPGKAWVHLPITMGYDRFPERLIDEKAALLAELLARGGRLLFTHDPAIAMARVVRDEDGAPQEDNQHEMDDVESHGGSMSLYVIPGQTSITREHIADYTRRGHTISVHPDLLSTRGKSQAEQLATATYSRPPKIAQKR